MWKLFAGSLCFAASVFAQENPSAYEALRIVGTQVDRALVSHVISVTGVDGNPQPQTWKILIQDRHSGAGVREATVRDGQLVGGNRLQSVVGTTQGATINTSRLNLDSTGAYAVAAHTAETSHVVFSFVSYTLRTDERGNPIWIVTLQDNTSRALGTIHIRANTGTITRVEGMYQGRNMEQVEDDRHEVQTSSADETENSDENIVKRDIKRMFRRTKDEAGRMFSRVRRSFTDFFDRR